MDLREIVTHLNNMLALSAMEAFDDAALSDWPEACVIGTSKSSLRAIEDEVRIHRDSPIAEGFPDAEDRWLNAFLPDAPLRTIRWLTQSDGPSSCPVAACATGLIRKRTKAIKNKVIKRAMYSSHGAYRHSASNNENPLM